MLYNLLKAMCSLSLWAGFTLMTVKASYDDFDFSLQDGISFSTDLPVTEADDLASRSANPPIDFTPIKGSIDAFQLWQSSAVVRSRHPLFLPSLVSDNYKYFTLRWNVQFQKHSEMIYPFVNRLNFDFTKTERAARFIKLIAGLNYSLFEEGRALFEKMNVQERRGIVSTLIEVPLSAHFFLRLNTSVVGVQRNYGPEELEDEGAEFFKKVEAVFEGLSGSTVFADSLNPERLKASFSKIPFEIGLGDAKIQLGFIPVQNEHVSILFGAECLPPLSALFNSLKPEAEPEEFSLQYEIDRIHRVVRAPVIGFAGNWGLGCFFEGKVPLFGGKVDIFSKMSFDKILAKETERDIMIDNEVFPHLLLIDVTPGSIQHLIFGIQGNYKGWRGSMGYDYYQQGKELLSLTSKVPDNKKGANLKKTSEKESVQHSLFSSFEYEWRKENKEWLSVGCDSSVVLKRENIGHHWNIGLKAKMVF